jgi:PilZ domain
MKSEPHKADPNAAPTLADERRAAVRYLCNVETTCQPMAETAAKSWPARAVNISPGGISLVLDRRFEQGDILSIRLASPDGETARNLLLRVVYAKAQDDGSWRLGCAFASELGQEELRAFEAEGVRPTEPDFRAWMRFTCDVETTCRAVAPARDESWSVHVLDVSPAGMSLLAPRQFERGALLSVDLPGTGSLSRHVLVRVVNDRRFSSNQWIIGCELADQISDQELQCFQ